MNSKMVSRISWGVGWRRHWRFMTWIDSLAEIESLTAMNPGQSDYNPVQVEHVTQLKELTGIHGLKIEFFRVERYEGMQAHKRSRTARIVLSSMPDEKGEIQRSTAECGIDEIRALLSDLEAVLDYTNAVRMHHPGHTSVSRRSLEGFGFACNLGPGMPQSIQSVTLEVPGISYFGPTDHWSEISIVLKELERLLDPGT